MIDNPGPNGWKMAVPRYMMCLRHVELHGPKTVREIANDLSMHYTYVGIIFKELYNHGYVRRQMVSNVNVGPRLIYAYSATGELTGKSTTLAFVDKHLREQLAAKDK